MARKHGQKANEPEIADLAKALNLLDVDMEDMLLLVQDYIKKVCVACLILLSRKKNYFLLANVQFRFILKQFYCAVRLPCHLY